MNVRGHTYCKQDHMVYRIYISYSQSRKLRPSTLPYSSYSQSYIRTTCVQRAHSPSYEARRLTIFVSFFLNCKACIYHKHTDVHICTSYSMCSVHHTKMVCMSPCGLSLCLCTQHHPRRPLVLIYNSMIVTTETSVCFVYFQL